MTDRLKTCFIGSINVQNSGSFSLCMFPVNSEIHFDEMSYLYLSMLGIITFLYLVFIDSAL